MQVDYNHLIDKLIPVMWNTSDEIMKIYSKQNFDSDIKPDKSPITEADLCSHDILTKALKELTPNIPIISEENRQFDDIGNAEHYWVIDPLDGTKEFIAKNGEFTINVALVKNDYPVLGMVLAPVFDELYTAIEHQGSFQMDRTGKNHKIVVESFKATASGVKILCSRSHLNEATEAYIEALNSPHITKKGGSMKFMDLAAGRAHIYPRFGPTMEWDTCAPQIIVEEAGGTLIDQVTNKRMAYGKDKFLNNFFVVFAKQI